MSSSSWFSFPNPLNSDDDQNSPPSSPTATATVKPDFSVITQTIGRQLHNVASFLAPPPQQPYSPSSLIPPPQSDVSGDVSPSSYKGIKNDLAELSGSFKTGLSLLSPKKAVNQISKFASNLLQFHEETKIVGINDDVVDFVREISIRPEFWIDFPLSLQNKDFSMSNVQRDHIVAVKHLVPNLITLKNTIQNYMGEEQFWMIYFILLLPRLNEDDCRLLSTIEIVQLREVLLQTLRNKNTPTGFSVNTPNEKGSHVNNTKQTKTKNAFQESECSTNRTKNENHEDDVSSASDASDWVRLDKTSKVKRSTYRERHSESSESSDWHAVEDGDL